MITQTKITALDFKVIQDYFDYILLSEINGQRTQVISLIKAMSKDQKKHCLIWFDLQDESDDLKICRDLLIKEI